MFTCYVNRITSEVMPGNVFVVGGGEQVPDRFKMHTGISGRFRRIASVSDIDDQTVLGPSRQMLRYACTTAGVFRNTVEYSMQFF